MNDVAGIDDDARRRRRQVGRSEVLRGGKARAQPQPGGENDSGACDAHQDFPQLRMLEMVPDIWSAAWMTFEFIS